MRQNKRTMIGIIFVVFALMVALLIAGTKLNTQITEGNTRIAELQEQTDAEEQRTEEIKSMQEYMQSDEYKEQQAKEKLGLIKDDEIIFKEATNE